jgi:hypothetical protein
MTRYDRFARVYDTSLEKLYHHHHKQVAVALRARPGEVRRARTGDDDTLSG